MNQISASRLLIHSLLCGQKDPWKPQIPGPHEAGEKNTLSIITAGDGKCYSLLEKRLRYIPENVKSTLGPSKSAPWDSLPQKRTHNT